MWQVYIKFIRTCCLVALLLPALAIAAAAPPQKNFFVEGQDYVKLPDSVRANTTAHQVLMTDPHKVQVLFFFSYGCHGCEMFHKPFEEWLAKQKTGPKGKVVVYTYPVSFNAQWSMLARLYYVRQILDPLGKTDNAIFLALQKQGMKLWDVNTMKSFFILHGYTAEQFDQAYNSFNVNRQVQRADAISKAFNIVLTPEVIVNG
ncbi:MAG TPA: thiol:disulfide interchange protein DsbA/DsbL, partial [Gammaproteobacteria bacterium]|nr:thiol:disulfide interchange protein DsbA/DsbL [Gammaproteobacteria bacterium]